MGWKPVRSVETETILWIAGMHDSTPAFMRAGASKRLKTLKMGILYGASLKVSWMVLQDILRQSAALRQSRQP